MVVERHHATGNVGVGFVRGFKLKTGALGSTVAIFVGSEPGSTMSYVYALGFTTIGAALFALTRTHEKGRVPQEAIIGIVYGALVAWPSRVAPL